MYIYKFEGETWLKKSVGVKYNGFKNEITFEKYINCLRKHRNYVAKRSFIY